MTVADKLQFRRTLSWIAVMLGLAIILVWTLFPIWWAFALSIKTPPDFFTNKALPFVQFNPTLDNWRLEWRNFGDPAGMGHSLVNSLIVATLTSGVSLVIGGLAAYGLALRWRDRRLIWPLVILFLLPKIFPPVVTVFSFSTIMRWLGLADTLTALVIAHTTLALPLTILILFSAILEIPTELLDAARINGCGWFDGLRLIVTPLLKPIILTTGILCFALSWNEFIFALMNVKLHAQTAPLAVASLLNKDGVEFEYVGSHLLMVTLPPLLLVLAAQHYLVRGLSLGAIKDDSGDT